jgi:hypothetical protein
VVAHKHFLSLLEEIGKNLAGGLLSLQFISIANTSVERLGFASYGNRLYVAVVRAMLTFK